MNDQALQFLRRTQLLRLLTWREQRPIGGRHWKVPLTHDTGWTLLHDDTPWMNDVLRRTLPLFPGSVVVSNASSGRFLLHVKAVDLDRNVMLFAPQQGCIRHLRHMARLNRLEHVHFIEGMLADASGSSTLHVFAGEGCDDTATLKRSWKFGFPASEAIPVQTFSLDNLVIDLVENGKMIAPGVIRIQARGAEARVLAGMAQVMHEFRPLLSIQWPPVFRAAPDTHMQLQEQAEGILRAADYVLFRVLVEEGPIILEAIDGPIGPQPDVARCAHLAVHRSQAAELRNAFQQPRPA